MPANFTLMETNLRTYFETVDSNRDENETADTIASEYGLAMSTATDPVGNALLNISTAPIASALKSAFALIRNTTVNNPATWTPVAASVTAANATIAMAFGIPNPVNSIPAGMTISTGILLTFPGVPNPAKWYSAFEMKEGKTPADTAADITEAFQSQFNSITVTHNGLVPAAPSPIPCIAVTGLQ